MLGWARSIVTIFLNEGETNNYILKQIVCIQVHLASLH
uniref:Uncharacterized protein n=1 Tax=Anguilla anguilla TaxID=7936 RepID=A0A0E9XRZ7_ANGAN